MHALAAETKLVVEQAPGGPDEDRLLAGLFANRDGSLSAVMRRVLRVARAVRDRMSADTWRVLTALDDELHPPPGDAGPAGKDEIRAGPSRSRRRPARPDRDRAWPPSPAW